MVIANSQHAFGIFVKGKIMLNYEKLSDFIADMILGGATKEEIYRVVSYSQKAMEASKAYIDYNIADLERKYGGKNERKA